MGLIRDAIGSALGAGQVNNGFSGTKLPFGNTSNGRDSRWSSSSTRRQSLSPSQRYSDYANHSEQYRRSPNERQKQTGLRQRSEDGFSGSTYRRNSSDGFRSAEQYPNRRDRTSMGRPLPNSILQRHNDYDDAFLNPPPCYETATREGRGWNQVQSYNGQRYTETSYAQDGGFSRSSDFRPLALPQIAYGDGQPFLRGYSHELGRYNISKDEFLRILDAINVAIIPNPENQIFQKGASIAGFFVPGAAGIGLMVGQIGVGLGAAVGHASQLSRVLSKANLNIFLPNGLEICIGKSTDVDAEVGIPPGSARPGSFNVSPEERQSYYGNLIAPLSQVLPPLQQSGRSDPIAMLGKGMSSRDSQKKSQRAEKKMAKGKMKGVDNLEGGIKWLIVRRASADALAYWQRRMQENDSAMEQEQDTAARQHGYR